MDYPRYVDVKVSGVDDRISLACTVQCTTGTVREQIVGSRTTRHTWHTDQAVTIADAGRLAYEPWTRQAMTDHHPAQAQVETRHPEMLAAANVSPVSVLCEASSSIRLFDMLMPTIGRTPDIKHKIIDKGGRNVVAADDA